jgi:hypothetical protein
MRIRSERVRKIVILIGFCLGIAAGLVASFFLLPFYIELLLLVANLITPTNPLHGILLVLGLIFSATPLGFGSTFLVIVASIKYCWYAMPIVYLSIFEIFLFLFILTLF